MISLLFASRQGQDNRGANLAVACINDVLSARTNKGEIEERKSKSPCSLGYRLGKTGSIL